MQHLTTEAILLRAVEFGESDLVVHLLTPASGRLTVIAKGARRSKKRFPGTLDLFNHLRIGVSFRRRGAMGLLEQATLCSAFLGLRLRTPRYALATFLLELFDRMAPEGGARPDTERIFAFALGALRALEHAEPDRRLRVYFELRALEALGLCPELRHCVRCGESPRERIGFHVADGGVVCSACSGGAEGILPVHLGTLRVLQQSLDFDLGRLGRLALSGGPLIEAEHVLFRFQRFHLGLELRSERFLQESLHAPAA